MAVQENYQRWDEKLSNALDSLASSVRKMTTKHKVAMSPDDINEWKHHVTKSEQKYRDYTAATFEVIKSSKIQAAPPPVVSVPLSTSAQGNPGSSTQAKRQLLKSRG